MTTPTPTETESTPPAPEIPTGTSAEEMQQLLERRAQLEKLQQGLRRARARDDSNTPPPAVLRDLRGLDVVMARAYENQAYYFSQPGWNALTQVHRSVTEVLRNLNTRAEREPQDAIQAARITTLAASLIARHAAEVSSYLNTWKQQDSPGGQAMRTLVKAAEIHAALAAGLDSGQDLDTPRLRIAHAHKLSKELRRAEPSPGATEAAGMDDPDDPALDSALSIGAAVDPELAEAARLMHALTELGSHARRAGHRLALDVRLHGLVETAQLRGFETISGIARTVMRRYDNQGQETSGRRNIAAMIFHYAEQRLERMRGTLGADEHREVGHYESDPPERYMDALFEESRTVVTEMRAKHITPQERTNLQIRFLLAQKEIAADAGDPEWGTQPRFPPIEFVAGMQTDNLVETRFALIEALRRRVENNPFHRDAEFLNKVKDRFAHEIAGPPELTAQALDADITADQIRAVAEHLLGQDAVASPLVLSETSTLNLTHPQAERVLAVLQTLNVVGPPKALEPRETLVQSHGEVDTQLTLLEGRLPDLLELQKGAAELAASPAGDSPTPSEPAPTAEAPAMAKPDQTAQNQTPAAAEPTPSAEAAPAPALPKLPRRDRSVERPHPGNLRARSSPTAEPPTDQELAQLLEGQEDRLKEESQRVIDGKGIRAAAYPAPAETTPGKANSAEEAHHNAQQTQQNVGVGVR
ncbi:hypothetical protein ACH4UR_24880 [Streptomyces lydicus]|uniref:hypothetical protein n=1 Tax=Streptomyces lydicus TaxID=47763 RepID=UPI0033F381FC